MFGFFVMGFVDIVGITTSYVKNDFSHLTDTMVNLISLSCFLWFLVLSIPTGMLMNRIGRKKTVLLSFAFHVLAMCLPLVAYDFTAILIAFALIGIGNTLLQVSLNPLVTDVVANDKLTGTLTLGQFVKAVSSFLGPILAAWVTGSFFGWKMIFPVYAGLSLLALIWLWLTPIQEKQQERKNISFKVTLELFKDKYILAFFIGILVLVGVDVGINMTFPKFLMERCDLPLTDAGMGNSVYFFARTVGVFGIGYANLFSIIFSLSLKRVPEKANEVSALLIVGVSGGAVLPPILGVITDSFHSQLSAIIVLAIVWCYLIGIMRKIKTT